MRRDFDGRRHGETVAVVPKAVRLVLSGVYRFLMLLGRLSVQNYVIFSLPLEQGAVLYLCLVR